MISYRCNSAHGGRIEVEARQQETERPDGECVVVETTGGNGAHSVLRLWPGEARALASLLRVEAERIELRRA